MLAVMARTRITIDTEDAHKRAFLARVALLGLTPQKLFEQMVEAHCPNEFSQARKELAAKQGKDQQKK